MDNVIDNYKNKFVNVKAVYIIGSGSTINDFKEPEEGVYIGANKCFLNNYINKKLNISFIEHITEKEEKILNQKITVFYDDNMESVFHDRINAHKYGEDNKTLSKIGVKRLYNGCSSTIFHCFMFALYTGCKKIYLVGCDCTVGKFYNSTENNCNYGECIPGWIWMKDHITTNFPNVEVIIVNPVQPTMKKLFKNHYI